MAPIEVRFYADADGDTRWRAVAANGKKIADSGEGYADSSDAVHAAVLLTRPDLRTDLVFVDADGAQFTASPTDP